MKDTNNQISQPGGGRITARILHPAHVASPSPCRGGFTLVELLVVGATIAILASLVLSAVNGGVEKSRQVKCTNNLRQIGMGIINCAKEDPDLQLPMVYNCTAPG